MTMQTGFDMDKLAEDFRKNGYAEQRLSCVKDTSLNETIEEAYDTLTQLKERMDTETLSER